MVNKGQHNSMEGLIAQNPIGKLSWISPAVLSRTRSRVVKRKQSKEKQSDRVKLNCELWDIKESWDPKVLKGS